MIRFLANLFIFVSLTQSLFQNKKGRCEWIKTALYKQATVFNQMTDEDRERLYMFSMRGIVHEFLRDTTFTDQKHEQRKTELLEELRPVRKDYRDWKDPESKQMIQTVKSILSEVQTQESEYHRQGEAFGDHNKQIKLNKANLNIFLAEMFSRDRNLPLKSQHLKNINESISTLETVEENNASLLAVFDDIKSHLNQTSDDSSILAKLQAAQKALEDLLYVKETVDIENETASDFELTQDAKIQDDLQKLNDDVYSLESQVNNLKNELKGELEKKAELLQSDILNAHDYSNFKDLVLETKEMLKVSVDLELEQMEMNQSLLKLSFIRNIVNYQKLRVHAREILMYRDYLESVQNLMLQAPQFIEQKKFLNKSLKQNALDYFTQNMTRMKDLFVIRQDLSTKLETLQELLRIERELDFIFAKSMAELQGGKSSDKDVFRCFSKLEMSVYSFYMNVTQVVVSKNYFYNHFMASLDANYQTMLMKKMYQDLEQRPLEDPQVIDPYDYGLVENGMQQWVLNYSVLYNQNLDFIFKNQITPVEEEYSIIKTIFECAGFTFELVVQSIEKGTVGLIFKGLTKAILSVLSISGVPGVIFTFLTKIVEKLTHLFLSWAGSRLAENPWIVKAFNEGKINLLALFTKSDMEYLDIEESLQEALDLEQPDEEKQDNDVVENFQQLFYRMVEVESCYDVAIYDQNYQNMFI